MPDADKNPSQPALDQLAEEPARLPHGGCADVDAVPIEDVPGDDDPRPVGDCYIHQPDRLLRRGPSWAGYAGDAHGDVSTVDAARPVRHSGGALGAYRAVFFERLARYAEDMFFRAVDVGDGGAVENVRGSGNVCNRLRDHAAGA